jgi:hypothetical protein
LRRGLDWVGKLAQPLEGIGPKPRAILGFKEAPIIRWRVRDAGLAGEGDRVLHQLYEGRSILYVVSGFRERGNDGAELAEVPCSLKLGGIEGALSVTGMRIQSRMTWRGIFSREPTTSVRI